MLNITSIIQLHDIKVQEKEKKRRKSGKMTEIFLMLTSLDSQLMQ